jgi:hypothetical protein
LRPALAVLLVFASACTSLRNVEPPAAATGRRVEVGDTVRIVTRRGEELVLTVTALGQEELVGERRVEIGRAASGYETGETAADGEARVESLRIPFADIATMQVREYDGWKTAALAGSIAATVTGLWLLEKLIESVLVLPPG